MSLRFVTLRRDGQLGKEQLVDARVCECCQTSAAVLANGDPYVVYRDRSPDETRDIWTATLRDGEVKRSHTINPDNWVIEGCPVNGPATRRHGNTVVVAWPTIKDQRAEVRVRFSGDSGKTFGKTLRVDDGQPLGRVEVVLLNSEAAVVSWLETKGGKVEIRWRVVYLSGDLKASQSVANTVASRASGFPQIEFLEGSLFFAWTDVTKTARVRTARVPITP